MSVLYHMCIFNYAYRPSLACILMGTFHWPIKCTGNLYTYGCPMHKWDSCSVYKFGIQYSSWSNTIVVTAEVLEFYIHWVSMTTMHCKMNAFLVCRYFSYHDIWTNLDLLCHYTYSYHANACSLQESSTATL